MLIPTTLQASILSALQATSTAPNPESAQSMLATQLSVAIDAYIRSATVNVAPGILVATSGGAGTTSGPGTGTIV